MAFVISLTGHGLAEEAGTGHHLPGSGVSLTGMLPAETGLTIKGSNWLYWGDAGGSRDLGALIPDAKVEDSISSFIGAAVGRGELPPAAQALAGQVSNAANARLDRINLSLDIDTTQNISTVSFIYATPWKVFGGRYYAGVALPFAYVETKVTLEARGPKGRATKTLSDSAFGLSDMVVLPVILGWNSGYFHWNTGLGIYAPTGQYSAGDLAPLGKGFWSFEPFAGFTYLNEKYGQEVSIGAAWAINTTNPQTDYRSGDQLNLEWLFAQHLPGGFSVGVTGYYYQQVTGDSGGGAKFGSFRAQTVAIGPSVGFTWRDNLAINAQWFYEVVSHNNFQGNVVSVNASWTF